MPLAFSEKYRPEIAFAAGGEPPPQCERPLILLQGSDYDMGFQYYQQRPEAAARQTRRSRTFALGTLDENKAAGSPVKSIFGFRRDNGQQKIGVFTTPAVKRDVSAENIRRAVTGVVMRHTAGSTGGIVKLFAKFA